MRNRSVKPATATTTAPLVSTVPTLKAHMWAELASIFQKFGTVPLSLAASHVAMKKFR
jgi:hypothetical protein